jgi:hypothetical protein
MPRWQFSKLGRDIPLLLSQGVRREKRKVELEHGCASTDETAFQRGNEKS